MDIVLQNDIYFIAGRLDEFAELDQLRTAAVPLQLNFGKLTSINSVGVRKFLAFAMAWAPRPMIFYECPPELISNINVIPQLVGKTGDGKVIKSFFVPFYCGDCKRTELELWRQEDVQFNAKGDVIVPPKVCSRCGQELELDAEASEYFLFLTR